ncbi:autotransporter domain-containing protein [Phyllobacterium sp. 628]|uniref:autotransporter domain-containing protein n=1 Tax=Phyllobacterium sp. 628 TaxID=2718938 RepID=UPI001662491F|nr:autotransporter domain-containing protein [Phyllobacterium sp. 628]QND52384.1 autotransporter domain-containing protein [Phyllobacterium sp. 628]
MRFRFCFSAVTFVTVFAASPCFAQTVNSVHAVELVDGFSQLLQSEAGKAALASNLETTIHINNTANAAQRAQAIKDNTIAALVGSISNGLLLSDALGSKISAYYAGINSIDPKTFAAKTFSVNVEKLFSQANAIVLADNGLGKNFYANGSASGNPGIPANGISFPVGGVANVYDLAYNPTLENRNATGDSRPFQVVPDRIQAFSAPDYFGMQTGNATDIFPTLRSSPAFPSCHAASGLTDSLLFAQLLPERFQESLTRGSEYGNSRVTLGVHYALDVIGARIMTTYALAQMLNNNPDYLNQSVGGKTTANDFQALFAAAQTDLRGALEAGCGTSISACAASSDVDRFSDRAKNKADYLFRLTYGLPAVGPTNLAPVVPVGAEVLIATRLPYLDAEQRREVLATTEIASGQALDDGSGWARLNLYAAADGYSAFNTTVSVTMDASKGGFNALDAWRNDIGGSGGLIKNGTGTLGLEGKNTYTGDTIINGGLLAVNGSLTSNTIVNDSGTLGGNGFVGGLMVHAGGTVAPGNSVGKLGVNGDATFEKGSAFAVEITQDMSRADQLAVGGQAILLGGVVSVSLEGSKTTLSEGEIAGLFHQNYAILTAAGGIKDKGIFEQVLPQYNYITTSLLYTDNAVSLDFDLTDGAKKAKADADEQARISALKERVKNLVLVGADTRNQKSVGAAIKMLDLGNPLLDAVLFSKVGDVFNYDSLSGEIHASVQGVLAEDSRFVRDAASSRIRAAFGDGTGAKASAPVLAYGPDGAEQAGALASADTKTTAIWAEGYGSWSQRDGTSNASGLSRNVGGFVTGLDGIIADGLFHSDWRLGLLAGYGNTSIHTDRGHGSADSYQVGVYGGTKLDAITLSLGASLAHHAIDTSRRAHLLTIDEGDDATYTAKSVQVFGEASYRIDTPYAALEPFAGAAYVHLKTDGFAETGGLTALSSAGDSTDLTTTTLGLRASHGFAISDATILTAHGMAGWRHAFGDTAPTANLAFAGGSAFSIDGLPIAQDTALVEAGFDVNIGKATNLGISYNGQFSSNAHDNAVKADLTLKF